MPGAAADGEAADEAEELALQLRGELGHGGRPLQEAKLAYGGRAASTDRKSVV